MPESYLTTLRPLATTSMARAILRRRIAWIDALRSGDYRQGRGQLYRPGALLVPAVSPDEYCCLGVAAQACRLPVASSVTFDWKTMLPDLDAERLGLNDEPAVLGLSLPGGGESLQGALAGMNDQYGWSFGQIADIIEEWTALQLYAGVLDAPPLWPTVV